MLLKNKVVLITGSTTGIGEGIAKLCIEEGAFVMIHGRDKQRAEELCQTLGTERTGYHLCELSNPESRVCQDLIRATVTRFGHIDCLINNAGAFPRDNINTVTPDSFDALMCLNLRAPLFLSQSAIKVFREKKIAGTIVNIGSINSYCGQSDLLTYSITKGGLMTLTRNLANALAAEKIRVNQLNVGWTLTETESKMKQAEGFSEDWENHLPKTYAPSGHLLRPENIAQHAVFWASEKSAPANGVVYEVEQYPIIGRNLINEILK